MTKRQEIENDLYRLPLILAFRRHGIEVDQRLRFILSQCAEGITDADILYGLWRTNSLVTRRLSIGSEYLKRVGDADLTFGLKSIRGFGEHLRDPETVWLLVPPMGFTDSICDLVLTTGHQPHTLGSSDFLRAILELVITYGDSHAKRPASADLLLLACCGYENRPVRGQPEVLSLLRELQASALSAEDFQYILTFDAQGRIVFRPTSVLDDYVQTDDSPILRPRRAILTHFQDQFCGFLTHQIEELEELLNNPRAREADFQDFFDRNPHFLRVHDHREVHSHVALSRPEPDGPLIPDFILTDREVDKAAIAELKLPGARLVRRQRNRDRFAAAFTEARAQLLRYRDWFRRKENRESLVGPLGMEIYEPKLMVIIGRSSEFVDSFDRQQLQADNPDIEVYTYDDIATFARRRRIIIEGGN